MLTRTMHHLSLARHRIPWWTTTTTRLLKASSMLVSWTQQAWQIAVKMRRRTMMTIYQIAHLIARARMSTSRWKVGWPRLKTTIERGKIMGCKGRIHTFTMQKSGDNELRKSTDFSSLPNWCIKNVISNCALQESENYLYVCPWMHGMAKLTLNLICEVIYCYLNTKIKT